VQVSSHLGRASAFPPVFRDWVRRRPRRLTPEAAIEPRREAATTVRSYPYRV